MIKLAAGINKGGGYKGYEWVGAINMKQVTQYTCNAQTIQHDCYSNSSIMCLLGYYAPTSQVYHIAKCKRDGDARLKHLPLEEMCRNVIDQAENMCVAVVKH